MDLKWGFGLGCFTNTHNVLFFLFHRPVLFYNSLGQSRDQVVKVYVNNPHVLVRDNNGRTVLAQVEPFWGQPDKIVTNKYKVRLFVISNLHDC